MNKILKYLYAKKKRIEKILGQAKTGKPFRAIAFRGVSEKTPIDEGMYGKGTYYTLDIDYAKQYAEAGKNGMLIICEVYLKNPFVGMVWEVEALGYSAYRNAIEKGKKIKEAREAFSIAITETLKSKGYDGIIIKDDMEVIVFDNRNTRVIKVLEIKNLRKES
jgi:hypothetical protein